MATTLYAIGLVVSAVGAGVSYYQQNKAADTQSQLATINAQAQRQALEQQGRAASMQALINESLANKEKAAAEANARLLERQAEAGTKLTTENIRRSREEMARLMAIQRAGIAKNGLVDTTGSPLSLLASTAEEEQRTADAMRYEDEMSRRSLFREAAFQRNAGILAGMQGSGSKMAGAAARAQTALGQSQSRLDLYAARANASALRTNATSNLISGIGGLSTDYATWKKLSPRTAKSIS